MRQLVLIALIGALDGPWHGTPSIVLRESACQAKGVLLDDPKPSEPHLIRKPKQWQKG